MKIRFSLSTLLWLIVVVAILLAWWRDRRSLLKEFEVDRQMLKDTINATKNAATSLRILRDNDQKAIERLADERDKLRQKLATQYLPLELQSTK
jgi:uncharacterized membrane protein (DUF106 family)